MNQLLFIFLSGQSPEGEGANTSFFLMMGLVFVVMYFFMIRPQSKKAKETRKFRESLAKGDKIVTVGGIHGKIVGIQDATIMLEIEGGQRMKVERSAISQEYSQGTGASALAEGTEKK